MHSIFHAEAPEKVRTVPARRISGGHGKQLLRDIVCLALIAALLALLVLGCQDVYRHPEKYPPYTLANRPSAANPSDPSSPDGSGETTVQSLLQPVSQLADAGGAVGAAVPGALELVATMGEHQLTNQQFIYYYWDSFYSIYDQLGSYLTAYLSFTTPFDQQMATETMSWHEYLSSMALENWSQTMTLCDAAEAQGYVLSTEDEEYLTGTLSSLESYAAQAGYADADAYLHQLFDPCADVDSYREYNRTAILASAYASEVYQNYYDDLYDPNAKVQYCINVRHVLIPLADDGTMDDTLAQAQQLYEEWKAAGATEEDFIQMAKDHSQDGNASSGGLYEDVYPGQMVDTFNDWCFDESRQAGDHGIVETPYGAHIMYFVGASDTVYSDENTTAAQTRYNAWLDDLFSAVQYDTQTEHVVFSAKPE